MSAKTANAKLESEIKQEKGNAQDLRKMLADERNVMSTMDMEHQQQLVELEQRHQEKVLSLVYQYSALFRDMYIYIMFCIIFSFVQVLYFLNQLQNKPLCGESDGTKPKDEGNSKEKELLQRLKVQVGLH